jgi:hypothetical protein
MVLLILAFAITWFLLVLAINNNTNGNMTIYVDKTTAKKTLSLSESSQLTNPTGLLYGPSMKGGAWDQDPGALPEYSDLIDGDQSRFDGAVYDSSPTVNKYVGQNYIAYTFYLFNSGSEALNYSMKFNIEHEEKGLGDTLRVRIYEDGEIPVTYARVDERPVDTCVNFESDTTVITRNYEDFKVNQVRKYSIVIWIDKYDLDTTNEKIGGSINLSIQFTVTG